MMISHSRSATSVGLGTREPERSTSRSSSPGSGRSTPLGGGAGGGGLRNLDPVSGGGKDTAGARSVPLGLPPRTPHRPVNKSQHGLTVGGGEGGGGGAGRRVAVGLNDLEGSVLLEADDYRRIGQDVKLLKTMLLKLKREIQSEGQGSVSATPSSYRVRSQSSPAHSDLIAKLKQVTIEKESAQKEVRSLEKERQLQSSEVDRLSGELEQSKKENTALTEKVGHLEEQVEHFIERLEKLHADKHKLEDMLSAMKKVSYYEGTVSDSSWVQDIEDGDTLMLEQDGDALMLERDGDVLMLERDGDANS